MYHLQIILLKILNYQENHLCILKKAKNPLLSPVELLPGLVTNWRTDYWELLPGTYHWGNSEKVCANCLEFQQSLVYIVITRARPYQRLLRYLRSLLLLQVKDFDQSLHKYYRQLTAVHFHKSRLVEKQIDYKKVICFLQGTQGLG